jgi:hypothetical protein
MRHADHARRHRIAPNVSKEPHVLARGRSCHNPYFHDGGFIEIGAGFIVHGFSLFPARRFVFNTMTARKWHIDCMESQYSPALQNKGVEIVQVNQRKAGQILLKKTEITRCHPTDVF